MINRQQKALELLDQHGEALHRLLARLTRCEHTTRDLMQELFLRLSGSRGFEKASCPYAYAWKAAANLAFLWHRRRENDARRLNAVRLSETLTENSLDRMIAEEQIQRILQITASLRELPRNVIVMRYIEQKSYEEIADSLERRPDYIRALCSKTLSCLRNKLGVRTADRAGREVYCE